MISNWTGRFVFFCITVTRAAIRPACPTSFSLSATKSQALNLLSIARLKSAKSRCRWASCSRTRIDQISRCFSGSFWPTSLPLFHGSRFPASILSSDSNDWSESMVPHTVGIRPEADNHVIATSPSIDGHRFSRMSTVNLQHSALDWNAHNLWRGAWHALQRVVALGGSSW